MTISEQTLPEPPSEQIPPEQMSPSEQTTSRTRGRPTLTKIERKRARNLSVSDAAWQKLEEQIRELPVKTASELVEKIGLGEIQLLVETSPLGSIAICRRLKALMEQPVAVFRSILAFVRRTCRQLQLEPTDARVYDVTLKACTIVFYTGYTHPDALINNPSALTKWLCYQIVRAEADRQSSPPVNFPVNPPVNPPVLPPVDPKEIKQIADKISHAFERLDIAARSPEYKALQMKTLDGLTIKQIRLIFKLQKHDISKGEVCQKIKQGLVNFRELFYEDWTDFDELKGHLKTEPNPKYQIPSPAARYLHIALQTAWEPEVMPELEEILRATSHNPYLDFWLNEIDYCLRDRLSNSASDTTVRDRLAEDLDDHFQKKKKEIDRELAFCQTAEQIKQVLEIYAAREAGVKLPIERLLPN